MTRTVADAAILLDVLAAADPREGRPPGSAAQRLPGGARSQTVYAVRASAWLAAAFFGYNDATDRLVEAALADMKAQGAVIVDPAEIPNAGKYDATELEVLLYEFKADLDRLPGRRCGPSAPRPVARRRDCVQRARTGRARCRSSDRS